MKVLIIYQSFGRKERRQLVVTYEKRTNYLSTKYNGQ